jgi:2-methylaconitate cis-trans-isomerase PrpF
MAPVDQYGIPCTYIRGGTSKALFFHEKDIPSPGRLRDTVLERVMGSPDEHQIDGMGGATTHTSKIAIVSPSTREDADVDFTFAQVSINQGGVSYKGNCGNISSAVGPFAIDEGIVSMNRKGHSTDECLAAREVRIYNTNTKKILISHVPVDKKSGFTVSVGDTSIAGVPGTGAAILMDYRNVSAPERETSTLCRKRNHTDLHVLQTVGGSRGSGLLPSGRDVDTLGLDDKEVEVTICDVGNISVFVRANDVGLTGSESATQISENCDVMARCKQLRGKAAQLIGMCKNWEKVDEQSPGLPFVVVVAPPSHEAADVNARLIFLNRCHDTIAGTGAVGTAACSRIPGSMVAKELRSAGIETDVLRINHPEGVMPIWVKAAAEKDTSIDINFDVLAFDRTARRIMTGTVFVPKKIWSGPVATKKEMFPKKTSLLLTGDINLLHVGDSTGPFRQVSDSLKSAEVVISNLECVLGTPEQVHSIEHEGFFADPKIGAEVLHHGNIAAVGIANNVNYGTANILGSIATLDKAGIPHAGAGANIKAARKPVIVERGGRRYGFLQRTSVYWPTDHAADDTAAGVAPLPGHTAYEALMYRYHAGIPPINRPGIPPIVTTWVDTDYLAAFTEDIKALRPQVDFLIASCHWGLGREVLTYMEQIAKAAIDAGADVVMGHGPHHPLPMGFHAGKPIFYGLGSFSFNMGHLGMAHGNWIGLLASLELAKEAANPEVSFRFARHNDQNETFLSHPDEEVQTFKSMQQASQKYGAKLWVDGDSIHAKPSQAAS